MQYPCDDNSNVEQNYQDQRDELLALESIFADKPDSFSYRETKDNLELAFEGEIKVELPKFERPIFLSRAGSNLVPISYLPPALLKFRFSTGYPSFLPPDFSIVSAWMEPDMVKYFEARLSCHWKECRGMPVLFAWTQMLQDLIISTISETGVLKLDDNAKAIVSSSQTGATQVVPVDVLKQLVQYQEEAIEVEFNREWHTCGVCCEYRIGSDSVRFIPCGHIFCTDCVAAFYHQKMKDSSISRLECLSGSCESFASQAQLRRVLSAAEFEKYEDLLLHNGLDLMSDVVACPRMSCQAPVLLENASEQNPALRSRVPARCSVCAYAFCAVCRRSYHGLEPCLIQAETVEDDAAEETEEEEEPVRPKISGRRGRYLAFAEAQSSKWIKANAKSCPTCTAKIQKVDGCNKVICTKCQEPFCWVCGCALPKANPFSHFNMKDSPCSRALFEVPQQGW